MTTLMEREAPAGMPRGSDRDADKSSRLSRWRASWRVALRMAVRDVRRYKGRSILVFVMVALPVAIIAGAAAFGSSQEVNPADQVTALMGNGQAVVGPPQPSPVEQDPSGNNMSTTDARATPVPGYDAGGDPAANARAIAALVGGEVATAQQSDARLLVGDRRVRVTGLVVSDLSKDWGDKARLVSGRWPSTSDEVAVTAAGVAAGMPESGTVTLSAQGTPHEVTVVGTASGRGSWYADIPDYVATTPLGSNAGSSIGFSDQYVIFRETSLPWKEVRRLNGYGLIVQSRAVILDPPPVSELPESIRGGQGFVNDTSRQVAAIGGVMLFLLTTLLVGPAFAVSAARSRRTLALAASNGAETRQLRRTVLAQAVVLGGIATAGGCVAGIALAWAGMQSYAAINPAWPGALAEFTIPWSALVILVPCAVLSAVVAALIPSLRLGRLDIVGVMRGQSVSPRLNRLLPVVGAVFAVGGALLLVAAVAARAREVTIALAAIALFAGTLMVIPALLVLAGRLAAKLPLAARMATRDAARHRTRTTPTVAAILAGVAALAAFSIGLASDTKAQMREYLPQAPMGEGYIYTADAEMRVSAEAALVQVGPSVVATPVLRVASEESMYGPGPGVDPAKPQRFVAAVPPGCTVEQSVSPMDQDAAKCAALGSNAYNNGSIIALPVEEIARRLGLDATAARAVADGALAVAQPTIAGLRDVPMVTGTLTVDAQTGETTDTKTGEPTVMAVVPVGKDKLLGGAFPQSTGAMIAVDRAKALGWPLVQEQIAIRGTEGAIDEATQKRLDEQLGDEGGFYVERGFQRYDVIVMRVMFGATGFLILVVTLISTALSMAEQQADMGTFAAVGATRRTRRGLAAWQALTVALIGSVLGVAVGLVPGIAVTYPLTAQSWDPLTGEGRTVDPTLVIPWLPLVLVVVGVPLVAALLAAAAIRKAPAVTRRAD